MTNFNYLKYYFDAVRLNSVVSAAKINHVSSSAVSQSIKWLEDWYQIELIEHGKNKFIVTEKGREFSESISNLLNNVHDFELEAKKIVNNKTREFKFSMQQSIANTVVAKVIKPFSKEFPHIKLKVRIGTSKYCKTMMAEQQILYSISMDNVNVNFDANSISLFRGKFIFISAKDDYRRPEDAGFLTTEDTKEVIELKSNYYRKYKKEIPINNSISSWGVIGNMAIAGLGIAYVPSYFLKGVDKSKYRIRKLDLETATYSISFFYSRSTTLTYEQKAFIGEVKRVFK